ncbi:MAG TPA: hypothetical protein VL172_12425 [Kofleriaceae bacterium]|nr:hypothetical protein [Kofleriaceae bacterium]
MRTTAMFLAAALAIGAAGTASAQVIRDHRGGGGVRVDRGTYGNPYTGARYGRDYRNYRYGLGGGYYYNNGLWQYDTPIGQPIRDPLWFRYPGVAAPRGPVMVTYDASGGYMWIAGYWEWYRGQWLWIDGYWEPARAGMYFAPGHWTWTNNTWMRTSGSWRHLPARGNYRVIHKGTRITNERVPARRGNARFGRY